MRAFSRRSFLRDTAILSAVSMVAPLVVSRQMATAGLPPRIQSIRLGGPHFSSAQDPEELARAHRTLGYRAAFVPGIPVSDTARIKAFEQAFARHDVVLAEVGRWVNLLDADPVKRRQNLDNVIDGLALAEAVGARCCVDISGSYSKTHWFGPHPDNFTRQAFDAAVENARKIIDAVKPKRAKFCFEMMGWAYPDSPDSCVKLLKAVDRPAFGVHLDPCNLIQSPDRFYRNSDLLNECFDKLGRWIVSCHAKDLAWEVGMNIHFREVVPGTGSLDYATYLKRLAKLPHNPPLMLEHMANAQEYAAGRDYIQATGRKLGLEF